MAESSSTSWRLILSPPACGAANMALDEAILESVARGAVPPTLRLYAWEPPCLSLGFAQAVEAVDRARLQQLGWDLVRRPTGGRAILHTDELTYALAAPAEHALVAGGVLPSYRRLSAGLQAGLARLGLTAEAQPGPPAAEADRLNPVCFEMPSAYEMTVAGHKLVGSAQVRRAGGVLQHGSLPLRGDITRVCAALCFEDDAARLRAAERLRRRAATLEGLLGRAVSWDQAAESLAAGFSKALGMGYEAADPTPGETARARALQTERYANPAWTDRV